MKRIFSAILAVVMMLSIAPVANIFVNTDTAITASAASTVYYKVVNTGTSGLCLRKGPGTNYAKIIVMPNGSKVKYLGKSGSFYKVSYTNSGKTYTGYASSSYLSKVTSSGTSSSSLSSKDKKYLQEIFTAFEYAGIEIYNSSSSYAQNKAYNTMFYALCPAFITHFDHYGWSYKEIWSNNGHYSVKDPKGYCTNYYGYYKLSASKIDWILKNVYNVKPDHSKSINNKSGRMAYYSNGYYYYFDIEAGDACPEFVISSCTKSNGYYIIKGGAYLYGSNYGSKWGSFSAKFKLRTVDGKKVWSICTYSMKRA